jgi:trehalose/maltose transport system permease protein
MVDNGNLGSGSAASTSLTLIIFLTAVLFMRAARVKLNEESN